MEDLRQMVPADRTRHARILVAVKLEPEAGERLREQYEGVRPAYHMNKKHWSDLILERLDDSFVKEQIKASYNLVVSKLPKKYGIKIKE